MDVADRRAREAELCGVFDGYGLQSGVIYAPTRERALAYAERCCIDYGAQIIRLVMLESWGEWSISVGRKEPSQ